MKTFLQVMLVTVACTIGAVITYHFVSSDQPSGEIVFIESGGIAGLTNYYTVSSDGTEITLNELTRPLNEEDYTALLALIDELAQSNEPTHFSKNDVIRDGYVYHLDTGEKTWDWTEHAEGEFQGRVREFFSNI